MPTFDDTGIPLDADGNRTYPTDAQTLIDRYSRELDSYLAAASRGDVSQTKAHEKELGRMLQAASTDRAPGRTSQVLNTGALPAEDLASMREAAALVRIGAGAASSGRLSQIHSNHGWDPLRASSASDGLLHDFRRAAEIATTPHSADTDPSGAKHREAIDRMEDLADQLQGHPGVGRQASETVDSAVAFAHLGDREGALLGADAAEVELRHPSLNMPPKTDGLKRQAAFAARVAANAEPLSALQAEGAAGEKRRRDDGLARLADAARELEERPDVDRGTIAQLDHLKWAAERGDAAEAESLAKAVQDAEPAEFLRPPPEFADLSNKELVDQYKTAVEDGVGLWSVGYSGESDDAFLRARTLREQMRRNGVPSDKLQVLDEAYTQAHSGVSPTEALDSAGAAILNEGEDSSGLRPHRDRIEGMISDLASSGDFFSDGVPRGRETYKQLRAELSGDTEAVAALDAVYGEATTQRTEQAEQTLSGVLGEPVDVPGWGNTAKNGSHMFRQDPKRPGQWQERLMGAEHRSSTRWRDVTELPPSAVLVPPSTVAALRGGVCIACGRQLKDSEKHSGYGASCAKKYL